MHNKIVIFVTYLFCLFCLLFVLRNFKKNNDYIQKTQEQQLTINKNSPNKTLSDKKNLLDKAIQLVSKHEGCRRRVYVDTAGHQTIGIGFNLQKGNAIKRLLPYDYDKVLIGSITLSKEKIVQLFIEDIETAILTAKKLNPNFDSLPENVQLVLIDMSFNLGESKLRQFKKFLAALRKEDFHTAAKEMKCSCWYSQVGNRARELEDMMLCVAASHN